MTFYVYDEDGYKGDFGTNKGAHDYMAYLFGLDREELEDFTRDGYDISPEALLESLKDVNPPKGDITSTHENFLSILEKCKGIVILSNGLNDDLEDE
jgi:hypothetical protein